jgi:hypothetical protein
MQPLRAWVAPLSALTLAAIILPRPPWLKRMRPAPVYCGPPYYYYRPRYYYGPAVSAV